MRDAKEEKGIEIAKENVHELFYKTALQDEQIDNSFKQNVK